MATNQMLGGSAVGTVPSVFGAVGGGGTTSGGGGSGGDGATGASGPTGPTGPTGPVAGSDTQIIFNRAGVAGATGVLAFNYTSGTLTTSALAISNNAGVTGTATLGALTVTNATSMTGNLNMNLCNISNVGTGGYSLNAGGPSLSFSVTPSATVVSSGDGYTYYVCTASCTVTPNQSVTNVKYFSVGGGGGGAWSGGGGGAGGLQTNDPDLLLTVSASQYRSGLIGLSSGTTYTITIGSGGAGAFTQNQAGSSGTSTIFSGGVLTTISALGGGGGGAFVTNSSPAGLSGGCGGGGSWFNASASSIGLQGYAGGRSLTAASTPFGAGGGGGIGGAGGDGTNTGGAAGAGGSGLLYSPVSRTYGGGGGGAASGGGTGAAGGSSIGGAGGTGSTAPLAAGGNATVSTGSGGGGQNAITSPGTGNGSSGVFILAIPTAQVLSIFPTQFGSMSINSGSNVQIASSNSIVLNPSTGGNVTVSGALSATGTTTVSALTVANNAAVTGTATLGFLAATTMTGTLDMNLNNLTNSGSNTFSLGTTMSAFTFSPAPQTIIPIGSGYTYYRCSSTTTINVNYRVTGVVYFAVGGGGGGGPSRLGGGGAGGLRTNDTLISLSSLPLYASKNQFDFSGALTLLPGTYTATIGTGGAGSGSVGSNGTLTSFTLGITPVITSAVGGGGGGNPGVGSDGGCGGGGGVSGAGGAGSQGGNGGSGTSDRGGGGGGIVANGLDSSASSTGGAGFSYTLFGTLIGNFGGGGGGGNGGGGSAGGATIGGSSGFQTPGGVGVASSGSGGGAGAIGFAGSAGTSGIFIIGIPNSQVQTTSAPVLFGSIAINPSGNLQLSANSNIVLNPSSSGSVTVSSGGFNVPAGTATVSALSVTNNATFTGTNNVSSLVVTNNASFGATTTMSALTVNNNAGVTGTATLGALTVTNATSMTGALNMNLCNISNVGTGVYSILDATPAVNFIPTSTVNSINTLYSDLIAWIDCKNGSANATSFTDRVGVAWSKVGTPTFGTYSLNGTSVLGTTSNNYFSGTLTQTKRPVAIFGVWMFPNGINSTQGSVNMTTGPSFPAKFLLNTGIYNAIAGQSWPARVTLQTSVSVSAAPYNIVASSTAGRIMSIVVSSVNTTSNTLNLDGTVIPLSTSLLADTNDLGSVAVSIGNNSPGFGLGTAELLIYNSEFTTAQTQTIEGYLAWKWGLQAQLPITHPYASASPYGSFQILPRGSIAVNPSSNLLIASSNSIVLNPSGSGNVTVSGALSTTGTATLSALTVNNNATISGNLLFPTVNVFTVSATSLTLTTGSAGWFFFLSNSGFSNLTLPGTVPTVAGMFWTLRNATSSYLSATVVNNGNLATPLILTPSNNTTIVVSVSGINGATISGYILF